MIAGQEEGQRCFEDAPPAANHDADAMVEAPSANGALRNFGNDRRLGNSEPVALRAWHGVRWKSHAITRKNSIRCDDLRTRHGRHAQVFLPPALPRKLRGLRQARGASAYRRLHIWRCGRLDLCHAPQAARAERILHEPSLHAVELRRTPPEAA